jgi:hypothetical protein
LESGARSHNVLQGEIRDGILTVKPKNIYLEGEHPYYFEISIRNTHMRFTVKPEKVVGYWGGYLNWSDYAYMYTSRPPNGADSIGIWHALKKMADSDPDPKSGQSRYISGTFRMEALPAYLADKNGAVVASPTSPGSKGASDKLVASAVK